jgi:hypothetical protein
MRAHVNVAEMAKLLAISEADFHRRYGEQLRMLNRGRCPPGMTTFEAAPKPDDPPRSLGRGRCARSRPT